MKVVILAGGFGKRIIEEEIKPKPLIEIGNLPILVHIMKIYSFYGHNDFIICLGYKGYNIKEYFKNFVYHVSDFTVHLSPDYISFHNPLTEKWNITLADTGENTETGGRLKRIQKYIGDETFMMTYGDGLARININHLINHHKYYGKYATILAVNPPSKFGAISFNKNDCRINKFQEKVSSKAFINGGFFVLEPEIFDYIEDDKTSWESDCLPKLAKDKQLFGYKHYDFWKCMDSIKDKEELCKMWNEGKAPWKIWEPTSAK